MAILSLLVSGALAQTAPAPAPAPAPTAEAPRPPPMVVGRAIVESWSDPGIGTVYATGGLLTGAAVVVPLSRRFAVDVEAGYRRLRTDDGAELPDDRLLMEVLPLSALAELSLLSVASAVDGFVGLGPAFAVFREHHPPNAEGLGVTRGMKLSLEARAGVRFDTGLVQPRMAPTSPIQGVDLEIYAAKRLQMPGGTGFDLDAWRASVGLGVRL